MISIKETELPNNWEKKRLHDVCNINPESINVSEYEKTHITYIDISSINNETNLIEAKTEIPLDEIPSRARRIVRKNDVIISTVRPYLKAFTKIKDQDEGNICSTGFAVLRSREGLYYDYLYHWIFGDKFMRFMILNMVGSNYPAVNISDVEVAPIIVPPYQEQVKIANILSNVGNLIQITQRLIEKLQECKKGLMQRLFTEGMGYSEFKRFGKWKIPNQWKIIHLKNVLEKIKNGTSSKQNQEKIGFPVTRIETISHAKINIEKLGYVEYLSDTEKVNLRLMNGDILFSNINSKKHIGKTAIYEDYPTILYHGMNLLLLRPNNGKVIPKFLHYELVYLKILNIFQNMSNQAVNQASINQVDLGKIMIFLPEIDEQRKIVNIFINIDKIVENEINFKNRMKIIKKGLMQVLLTGKKRVPV